MALVELSALCSPFFFLQQQVWLSIMNLDQPVAGNKLYSYLSSRGRQPPVTETQWEGMTDAHT